jgi:hypothetical protein
MNTADTSNAKSRLPTTLTVGCADGNLYRVPEGYRGEWPLVRENYCRHHREIRTVADLKATLRAGPYAWPGGYALYFVTADGATLSFEAVRQEFRQVAAAVKAGDWRCSGWLVIGTGNTAEDDEEPVCDHTGKPIK